MCDAAIIFNNCETSPLDYGILPFFEANTTSVTFPWTIPGNVTKELHLTPGTTYSYSIWAVDQCGSFSEAQWSSFFTAPDPADIDNDGDGYTENQGDLDDGDPSIHPGAVETPY
jgi:hypothetical protein